MLAEHRPPVFWGRDESDPIIPSVAVDRTTAWLPEHSTLTARLYTGMLHGVSQDEIVDVAAFLTDHLFDDDVSAATDGAVASTEPEATRVSLG